MGAWIDQESGEYTFSGLEAGTTYQVDVQAVNSASPAPDDTPSTVLSLTTTGGVQAQEREVIGQQSGSLELGNIGNTRVTATGRGGGSISRYRFQVNGGGWFTIQATFVEATSSSRAARTFAGLTPGTSYTFGMQTYDQNSRSWSATTSRTATTTGSAPAPDVPEDDDPPPPTVTVPTAQTCLLYTSPSPRDS